MEAVLGCAGPTSQAVKTLMAGVYPMYKWLIGWLWCTLDSPDATPPKNKESTVALALVWIYYDIVALGPNPQDAKWEITTWAPWACAACAYFKNKRFPISFPYRILLHCDTIRQTKIHRGFLRVPQLFKARVRGLEASLQTVIE